MPSDIGVLKTVPLFSLLDDEERALLAAHLEVRDFSPNQRIYRLGDAAGRGYILVQGKVRITTIDDDEQEVILDEQGAGGFFGFASMLDGTPHQTSATAVEQTSCLEIEREDIATLLGKKPQAGMDMLAVLGRQFHSAQHLVRTRSLRNPNEVIAQHTTLGDRVADAVARFGGSWRFLNLFLATLVIYPIVNTSLGRAAWDPYPFILLNLFLSMLAALQAPIIMMSQNRQDEKDRLRGELDFEVNRRAEQEIRSLARKINGLDDKISDIEDLIRSGGKARS